LPDRLPKSNAGLSILNIRPAMGEFMDGKPTVQRFKQIGT
jgi:hypothetical protein